MKVTARPKHSAGYFHINFKVIAAIDLGSNSFRLQIKGYQKKEGKWLAKTLTHDLHPVRLAENISKSGKLSTEAMKRGLMACRVFAEHLNKYTPISIRICGTEALRLAANSPDFIAAARDILGAAIEVLSPRTEAELTMLGCMSGMTAKDKCPLLLVDVGGASTEMILAGGADRAPQIRSLPVGALNMTEKFIPNRPETTAALTALSGRLDEIIRPALADLLGDEPTGRRDLKLLASGGTASAMAALDLKLQSYQPNLIQGHQMPAARIDKLFDDICGLDMPSRNKLPGLVNRGGIILAGIKIYQTIMEITSHNTLTISAFGMLEGIIVQLAARVHKSS